jgi:transposase InsO family protein
MIYVATAGGISGDLIRNLMAESIEARFGVVAKIPRRIQWLSDNDLAYIARETRFFAKMMGLEVCTTPIAVRNQTEWLNRSSRPSSEITSASSLAWHQRSDGGDPFLVSRLQ